MVHQKIYAKIVITTNGIEIQLASNSTFFGIETKLYWNKPISYADRIAQIKNVSLRTIIESFIGKGNGSKFQIYYQFLN